MKVVIVFFSLDWLGAAALMLVIMGGLAFDSLTPFLEFLLRIYPVFVVVSILGLIISTVYCANKYKSISKALMSAFTKSHLLFYSLAVPFEILSTLTYGVDPFMKLFGVVVVGLIYFVVFGIDCAMVCFAMEPEEFNMKRMGIIGVVGWIACFVLLF